MFQSLDIAQENKGLIRIRVITKRFPSLSTAPCMMSSHLIVLTMIKRNRRKLGREITSAMNTKYVPDTA